MINKIRKSRAKVFLVRIRNTYLGFKYGHLQQYTYNSMWFEKEHWYTQWWIAQKEIVQLKKELRQLTEKPDGL